MKLIVEAGHHALYDCPVRFFSDEPIRDHNFAMSSDGTPISAQYAGRTEDGRQAYLLIIPSMDAGSLAEFEVAAPTSCVSRTESVMMKGEIKVVIGGQYFTSYHFGTEIPKPYLGPLQGENGEFLTRHEYTGKEHPHHRGLWFSHGDINGVDTWNEPAGRHGFIRNRAVKVVASGPVFTQFTAQNVWTAPSGEPLCDDTTTLTFYNTPKSRRYIDVILTLTASCGDVTLGLTKEAGPLAVRMADRYVVPKGGRIENSFGGVNEDEVWMQRAHWNDYCGLSELGNVYGVAIFDHPQNPGYPSYFHTRNYGLMAPNNFHLGGPVLIPKGESLTFRYRVLIHSGWTESAKTAKVFANYVFPPKAELLP